MNKSTGDLSICAHALKSILGIKFTRAGQRHASAMGFKSANHLLDAVKINSVECGFEQYIGVLKAEMLANHQIILNEDLIERLRVELSKSVE